MRRVIAVAYVLAVVGLIGSAQAQDAANPTGTWKWMQQGRGGAQGREVVLKLKVEGDKVTGTITGRNNEETAISEGTFKDGTVTFKVTRQGRDGQARTESYTGKLENADTIKGKYSTQRQGATVDVDWEAKRDKTAAA
jgi:hypothetical protein